MKNGKGTKGEGKCAMKKMPKGMPPKGMGMKNKMPKGK